MMSLEELEKVLDKNINNADAALKELKNQQKALNDNAEKLKSSVRESIEAVYLDLKAKEKQLIRQVEFVTAHQKSLLDAQITNIWLTKGSLIGTQEILAKCTAEDTETLLKIEEKLPVLIKQVLPIKMISVKFDQKSVSSALEKFGEAHLPSTLMHYDSPVLPAKTEDYGDSEQDVLHKSLGHHSRSTSAIHINVKIPKLPENSWLASPTKTLEETKSSIMCCKDNSYWLPKPQIPAAETPQNCSEEGSEENFLLLSPWRANRNSSFRTSLSSSSIEVIIPPGDFEKDISFSSEVSNDNSSSFCDVRKDSSLDSCCQANEPCASYADCVTDGYCSSLAKEKAAQTNKWLEKSRQYEKATSWLSDSSSTNQGLKRKLSHGAMEPVLKHMSSIISSNDKNWIRASDNSSNFKSSQSSITYSWKSPQSWLSSCPKQTSPFTSKILYTSSSDASWVQDGPKPKPEVKEAKDNKNCSERKKELALSVEELKGEIDQLYETSKMDKLLFTRSEKDEFWLSEKNKKDLLERKLKLLSLVTNQPSVFPSKYVSKENNLDNWLHPKC